MILAGGMNIIFSTPFVTAFRGSERCLGVGTGSINVFVLISDQQFTLKKNQTCDMYSFTHFFFISFFLKIVTELTSLVHKKIKNKRRAEITSFTMMLKPMMLLMPISMISKCDFS